MTRKEKMDELLKMSGTIKELRKTVVYKEEFLDYIKKSVEKIKCPNPDYTIRMRVSYCQQAIVCTEKEASEIIKRKEDELERLKARLLSKEEYFMSQLIED